MPFDPNAASPADSGIFGLPYTPEESSLVLLPVPWEATTSYGGGAAKGPGAMFRASRQIDLFDIELGNFHEAGICLLSEDPLFTRLSEEGKKKAAPIIEKGGAIGDDPALAAALTDVNTMSDQVNEKTYALVKEQLKAGKKVGVMAGDHSSSFGIMKAFVETYPGVGVLQIDAHADLRPAFEGFEHSHGSIMYNAITKLPLKKLVQVGIRDLCQQEHDMIEKEDRIETFYGPDLHAALFAGQSWNELCTQITATLPQEVYISFDIDGLEPWLCPHTGTPVPGGLTFQQVNALFRTLVESGRTIVGFDLNEVSPGEDEWDANVGARVLFKLCGWMLKSWEQR